VCSVASASVKDISSVGEVSSTACEDVCACSNHVWGEGKLLAVEHEEVSVLLKSLLTPLALSLQSLDSLVLVIDLIIICVDSTIIVSDSVVVVFDPLTVIFDAVVEVVDFVVDVHHALSQVLQGNHHACFLLNSRLVVTLIQNFIHHVVLHLINRGPVVSGRD